MLGWRKKLSANRIPPLVSIHSTCILARFSMGLPTMLVIVAFMPMPRRTPSLYAFLPCELYFFWMFLQRSEGQQPWPGSGLFWDDGWSRSIVGLGPGQNRFHLHGADAGRDSSIFEAH